MLGRILHVIKNRYFIFTVIMVTWITFFDRYNLSRRWNDLNDLKSAEEERDYYKKKIEEVSKAKDELFSDQQKLEKFARERYFMKKDSEDIFIVEQ